MHISDLLYTLIRIAAEDISFSQDPQTGTWKSESGHLIDTLNSWIPAINNLLDSADSRKLENNEKIFLKRVLRMIGTLYPIVTSEVQETLLNLLEKLTNSFPEEAEESGIRTASSTRILSDIHSIDDLLDYVLNKEVL